MEKPFLPTKWWQWAIAVLLIALLGTVFLPATSSSGPAFGPGSIAQSIRARREKTGRWPQTGESVDVGRRFRNRAFSFWLRQAHTDRAIYRIVVDHRDELWRIDRLGNRPRRLATL